MGKRGPTPESAQIQGLKGNPGKRNAPSAVTAKRPPALPAHLKQYAAQVFEQIASGLPPGMLGEQDSPPDRGFRVRSGASQGRL